jgi:hypothetical protein
MFAKLHKYDIGSVHLVVRQEHDSVFIESVYIYIVCAEAV